jgi:hypothetical protein
MGLDAARHASLVEIVVDTQPISNNAVPHAWVPCWKREDGQVGWSDGSAAARAAWSNCLLPPIGGGREVGRKAVIELWFSSTPANLISLLSTPGDCMLRNYCTPAVTISLWPLLIGWMDGLAGQPCCLPHPWWGGGHILQGDWQNSLLEERSSHHDS